MKKDTIATDRQIKTSVDIEILTEEIETHRLVLAWLLKQLPNNRGRDFLDAQAEHFKTINKEKYAIMIDEFSLLKGHVSFSHENDEPSQ